MSRYSDLLSKFYNKVASDAEKRELLQALTHPEEFDEHIDEIWNKSFGQIPVACDHRVTKAIRYASRPRRTRMHTMFHLAAAVLLVLVSSFALYERASNRALTKYADMEIRVARGQKSDITLPDGTRVHLNACSELSYGRNFNGRKREVGLVGEAYFEVAKDKESPFIVKVGDLEIEALGTAFNIQAYPDEGYIATYLARGSVRVSSPTQSLFMEAGDLVRYCPISGQLAKNYSGDDWYHTAWMQDEMIFDNKPLAEIAKLLERYYNVEIEIVGSDIAKTNFSGTLKNENLFSVLEALQITSEVRWEIENNRITLYGNKKRK
ncbi:FecR domain-containing protein [Alistipes sp.]|uniref:FecR family protein n=1 Tax=Alistipes sp. TaxID=1872444 RepID=UPI0025BC3687|nr:FecR domain-containing protein [Alistipes sp.]